MCQALAAAAAAAVHKLPKCFVRRDRFGKWSRSGCWLLVHEARGEPAEHVRQGEWWHDRGQRIFIFIFLYL